MEPRLILRTALLLASALAAVACGGSTSGGEVSYEGDTLVVDGVSYLRRSDAEICPLGLYTNIEGYAPGVVYLFWDIANEEKWSQMLEARTRLSELGLATQGPGSGAVLVPVGWEDQWARALRAQPQIHGGEVGCNYGVHAI